MKKFRLFFKYLMLMFVFLISCGCANGWVQNGSDWCYYNNGSIVSNEWVSYNGDWYYLNENGIMAINRWIDNYYVGADGKMLKNTTTPDGYWVGGDGKAPNKVIEKKESSRVAVSSKWKEHKEYVGNGVYCSFYYPSNWNQHKYDGEITFEKFSDEGAITLRYNIKNKMMQDGWNDVKDVFTYVLWAIYETFGNVPNVMEDSKYYSTKGDSVTVSYYDLQGYKVFARVIIYNNIPYIIEATKYKGINFSETDIEYVISNVKFN